METQQQLISPLWKRRVPLGAFFAANLISYVGDRLTLIAIPWFVLQTTGSVAKTGIAAFFTTLPAIISAFFSGLVVDRLGYKRTSVLGDIASGASTLLIPLLFHTVGLAFWQLLLLAFLGGLLKEPGGTARMALLPELGKTAQLRTERLNALGDGTMRVSGLLGAPLAAFLIIAIGASNLLWLDAASFFLSALLIGISVPAAISVQDDGTGLEPTGGSLREGLSFLIHNRVLRTIISAVLVTNLLDVALFSVALPAYAQQIWGNILPLGLLSATFGGCAFLSTILFGLFGHSLPRRRTFTLSFVLLGIRFWALALQLPLPVLFLVYAFNGLAVGPINPIATTIEQELIPARIRARVFGISAAGSLGGIPLGGLLAGYLITWIGLIPTLFSMATVYLLVTGSLLFHPALEGMERTA